MCYAKSMGDLPPDIQARRAIEDRAAVLGNTRVELNNGLIANTQDIIDLLRDAERVGLPYEDIATLVGVSRQTLWRWREVARRLNPGESAADMAAHQTEDGDVFSE